MNDRNIEVLPGHELKLEHALALDRVTRLISRESLAFLRGMERQLLLQREPYQPRVARLDRPTLRLVR